MCKEYIECTSLNKDMPGKRIPEEAVLVGKKSMFRRYSMDLPSMQVVRYRPEQLTISSAR